jgi:hypothetical protein
VACDRQELQIRRAAEPAAREHPCEAEDLGAVVRHVKIVRAFERHAKVVEAATARVPVALPEGCVGDQPRAGCDVRGP